MWAYSIPSYTKPRWRSITGWISTCKLAPRTRSTQEKQYRILTGLRYWCRTAAEQEDGQQCAIPTMPVRIELTTHRHTHSAKRHTPAIVTATPVSPSTASFPLCSSVSSDRQGQEAQPSEMGASSQGTAQSRACAPSATSCSRHLSGIRVGISRRPFTALQARCE